MNQSGQISEKKNKFAIFKNIFYVISSIFKYSYIGLKAITFDLFVFLYNSISWKLDKAYRATKDVINKDNMNGSNISYIEGTNVKLNNNDAYSKNKNKKVKEYHYSSKKMAKLEADLKLLTADLQAGGATRNKEVNSYLYTAKDPNGKIVRRTMNGLSKLDIHAFLSSEGFIVYSIKTSPLINFVFKESDIISPKLSNKELVFWLTQLSTYIKAGITLNDAIKILSKQMKGRESKTKAFRAISYELTLGESFSNAIQKQGNMFPALLINMVKAAEAAGTLTETLDDLSEYYTEIDNTRKQMKSAMTYPLVITVFALGVVTFIMLFIIPRFVGIYESSGAKITGITKLVIDLSFFLENNILAIVAVLIILVVALVLIFKYVKAFRRFIQVVMMHIPVIKNIIIYNELTIFTKTFASLLRNNVYITDSMNILSKITNNEVYKEILYRTINNIVKGEKISEAFKDHWAIPDVAYFMIVTGESTGELTNMMQKVSDYYSEMHRNVINSLKAFIEPIMISVLALIVGVIIISVVIPMFQLYDELL